MEQKEVCIIEKQKVKRTRQLAREREDASKRRDARGRKVALAQVVRTSIFPLRLLRWCLQLVTLYFSSLSLRLVQRTITQVEAMEGEFERGRRQRMMDLQTAKKVA